MRYFCLFLSIVFLVGGLGMLSNHDRQIGLRYMERRLDVNRLCLAEISTHLRNYRKEHGHYPSNDEGLLAVKSLVAACKDYSPTSSSLRDSMLDKSGILSRWS